MLILTSATNYSADDVRPFIRSLKATNFDGRIACICNGSGAEGYLRSEGVQILQDIDNGFDINSRRFFIWKEALRGELGPTIITDIRDVIFQTKLTLLPRDGVNVFTEDQTMTIGTCPYNSGWMQQIFGEVKYANKPIICAGFTIGRLTEYCMTMWDVLKDLAPVRGFDQAVHNHLVYSGHIPATIYDNPAPVYTVGYIRPHNNVRIVDGHILGPNGEIPTVVHQYDRHPVLKENHRWQ